MENRETFFARLEPFYAPSQMYDVKLAYMLAKFGHRAQVRKELVDGVPLRYFEHLRRVALVLIDQVKIVDPIMVIGALMHDSLEDTRDLSPGLLEHCFGADLVTIVRALSKVPKEGYIERLEMCTDWRVLLLKGCDRYDNLMSIEEMPVEFIAKQVKETRQKYVPLFKKMIDLTPVVHKDSAVNLYTMLVERLIQLEDKYEILHKY
jgi:GTP pyrophosphokinase